MFRGATALRHGPQMLATTPTGTEEEIADLKKSYEHLCAMRQEIIDLGIVPAVEKWGEDNANL